MTKNTLGMKVFILLRLPQNCLSILAVGAEAQGRNLEQELKQGSWRSVANWLVLHGLPSCLVYPEPPTLGWLRPLTSVLY